jgi:hypothetical protein
MPVMCELHPRRDATPEQLKELGKAIEDWARRELGGEGILCSIDAAGLASLLGGEPPNPLGVQGMQHNRGINWEKIQQDLGSLVSDRSLRFTLRDEAGWPRSAVIENLRQAIPAELVEDILINNVSWTE